MARADTALRTDLYRQLAELSQAVRLHATAGPNLHPAAGSRSALAAGAKRRIDSERPHFAGVTSVMIRKSRQQANTTRTRMLSEHKEAILEAWRSPPLGTMNDRVVVVEQKGDHVTVAAASAKKLIDQHKRRLGLQLVDAIQARRRSGEPFVVVLDWDGADAGLVEMHQGDLRFRS